jgi:membrane-associated protease RseP (regulator of RpoE activity)
MNRFILAALAAATFASAMPAAQAQAEAEADVEKRLEEAQQRLEAAAREVAELAAEAGGPHAARMFEMHLPLPARAMLGINLGGTEAGGRGVRVVGVSPGGAAADAGVRAGDRIVAIDGKTVATGRDLVTAMRDVEPGQKVALELQRDGKPVKLTVAARPMDHVFFAGPGMAVPPTPGAHALPALPPMQQMALVHARHWLLEDWGDAELVTVTPALGRYFGADKGVLVARAPSDATLGLQDGDVIVEIGGREPQSGPHAMRILRSYQPGETVELRILRDRKAQTLKAAVPESKTGHAPPEPVAPPRPPAAPRPPASPT